MSGLGAGAAPARYCTGTGTLLLLVLYNHTGLSRDIGENRSGRRAAVRRRGLVPIRCAVPRSRELVHIKIVRLGRRGIGAIVGLL
jgi:hypothetical protein